MAKKYVYYFGDGKAEGTSNMKELLGGKGAGLAEMVSEVIGLVHCIHQSIAMLAVMHIKFRAQRFAGYKTHASAFAHD